MSADQQASVVVPSSITFDKKYVDFVEDLLKEAANDFEKEGKCMFVIYCLSFNDIKLYYFLTFLHDSCILNQIVAYLRIVNKEKEIYGKIEVN